MSEQLDWFARNVHEWPTETNFVFVGVGIKHGNMGWYVTDYGFSSSSVVTKQQWLARRAELQNKPSWKDAPEWATHMAQQADGDWMWCEGAPTASKDGGWFGCFSRAATGEVLGEWHDTLERRPADLSEQAVTARLQEATDLVASGDTDVATSALEILQAELNGNAEYCKELLND